MQYFLRPKNPYRGFTVHTNPFMEASVLCFQEPKIKINRNKIKEDGMLS